jgi:hypothetical protein
MTLAEARNPESAMLQGMAGSAGGYRAPSQGGDIIQHSWWLFGMEENAEAAEATFNQLRGMPGAHATSISVDVARLSGTLGLSPKTRRFANLRHRGIQQSQLTSRNGRTNIAAVQGGSHGIL